jgi:hypothetical protein
MDNGTLNVFNEFIKIEDKRKIVAISYLQINLNLLYFKSNLLNT